MSVEIDWKQKAIEFLKAAQFEKGYCHMRFRKPGETGRYTNFGIVYPKNVCEIFLVNVNGEVTNNVSVWNSVEEMVNAGWDVD